MEQNLLGWYEVVIQEKPGKKAVRMALIKEITLAREVEKTLRKMLKMRTWSRRLGGNHAAQV